MQQILSLSSSPAWPNRDHPSRPTLVSFSTGRGGRRDHPRAVSVSSNAILITDHTKHSPLSVRQWPDDKKWRPCPGRVSPWCRDHQGRLAVLPYYCQSAWCRLVLQVWLVVITDNCHSVIAEDHQRSREQGGIMVTGHSLATGAQWLIIWNIF